jgi:hypothetical protein
MARARSISPVLGLAGALLALAACAPGQMSEDISEDRQAFDDQEQQVDLSQTEGMLERTGFVPVPANTPERQRQMLALTPYKVIAQAHQDGTLRYVYADPAVCSCLYVGNEAAYNRLRDLDQAQTIADDLSLVTGGPSEAAVFDSGTWETASH